MAVNSFLPFLLFLLLGCEHAQQPAANRYRTVIYFQNGSDSEPEADLKIQSTDSTVFDGSVAYNGIPDSWHEREIRRNLDIQHISIVNNKNGVRLDTVITSTDTVTHVFLTYRFHALTHDDSVRLKRNAHNSEELQELYKMFSEPSRFSVLVMSGKISTP